MTALRIVALCLAAALVCTALRSAHPQIASVAALAVGMGALMLSLDDLGSFAAALRALGDTAGPDGGWLVKLCGLALVAELASDVCRDAGEAALARRIDLGVKLSVTAAALPLAAEILNRVSELLA